MRYRGISIRHSAKEASLKALTTLLAPALAAGALFAAGAAQAGPLPPGGVTAAEVAASMKAGGYTTELSKDSTGDPMIKGKLGELMFRILFYDCNASQRCKSIQYLASWDEANYPSAKANTWNITMRYGRVAIDKEGYPVVIMDVDLERGATTEALENWSETWKAVLQSYEEYLDK